MNRKWIALSLVIGTIATTGFAKDISPVTVTTSNMDTSASTIGSDQQYRGLAGSGARGTPDRAGRDPVQPRRPELSARARQVLG